MDADKVVVEADEPRSKCQKLTERLPSSSTTGFPRFSKALPTDERTAGFSYLPWEISNDDSLFFILVKRYDMLVMFVPCLVDDNKCLVNSWLPQHFVHNGLDKQRWWHIGLKLLQLASSKAGSYGVWTGIDLTTCARMTLPIIRHLGFPVATLLFNLQLFQPENLKLVIWHQIFRRNTVPHSNWRVLRFPLYTMLQLRIMPHQVNRCAAWPRFWPKCALSGAGIQTGCMQS